MSALRDRHGEHLRVKELLSSYVLGILEEDDRATLEKHLDEGCKECEAEMRRLMETVETMADSVEPLEPSETTKRRILAATEPATPDSSVVPATSTALGWRLASAAALVLLLWSGWSQMRLSQDVKRLAADRQSLDRQLTEIRVDLARTRADLDRALLVNQIVSSPKSRTILLAGLKSAPDSAARTYFDEASGRAMFYASDLKALPADQTYQLWWIVDGAPVSAGIFEADADGSGTLVVEAIAGLRSIDACAVTIESAGGAPAPTGPMVLSGAVTTTT